MKKFVGVIVFLLGGHLGFAETLADFKARKVQARSSWGAQPAKLDMTPDPVKTLIAIHHSAGVAESDGGIVRGIQNSHFSRKFSDIGYHFLVAVDGTIFEGRDLYYQGAHVLKHNNGTIGLNLMGCFDNVECHPPQYPAVASVTEAMIKSMSELVGVLCTHYNIEIDEQTVKGHREFAGAKTACPGDRVLARMPEIRRIAKRVVSGKTDEL